MNRKEKAMLQDLAEKLIDLSNGRLDGSAALKAVAKRLAKEAGVTVEVEALPAISPRSRRTLLNLRPAPESARTPELAASRQPCSTAGTTRRHKHGTSDLPDGLQLYTVVRMERKAAGQKRRVQATVRGGQVFVDGRRNGFSKLSKALESARGVAGKADRKGTGACSTRAWRLSSTGETVEEFRRSLTGRKPRKTSQMSLVL